MKKRKPKMRFALLGRLKKGLSFDQKAIPSFALGFGVYNPARWTTTTCPGITCFRVFITSWGRTRGSRAFLAALEGLGDFFGANAIFLHGFDNGINYRAALAAVERAHFSL